VRFFAFFLTWWGAYLIALLDASMVFFLPFGVDAVVIYLAASHRELAWLYPLLATAGSITGAAGTFWIGQKIGEVGLERYVPRRRLERLQCRVRDTGAVALAVPALMPPPFPLTPFVLTCGALRVNPWRFFSTFAADQVCPMPSNPVEQSVSLARFGQPLFQSSVGAAGLASAIPVTSKA